MAKYFFIFLMTVGSMAMAANCVDPFAAVEEGKEVAIAEYLYSGGSASLFNPEKGSLLFVAALQKQHLIASLLIKHGADFLEEPDGRSPAIEVAVVEDDVMLLKEILTRCENCVDHRLGGYTLLMIAAMEGSNRSMEYLIEHGANPNSMSTTDSPRTALYYAIVGKHFETAEMLASSPTDIHCGPRSEIWADIEIAAADRDNDLVEALQGYCLNGDSER